MTAAAAYTAENYRDALLALLPRGRVWPRDSDSVLFGLATGLTGQFEPLDASAQQLILDANPNTTLNLLEEWEATLGLPDPCLGGSPTVEQRQASVRARFQARSDGTAQFFIQYAAALGYTITVTPDAPFRMGVSGMGDGLGDYSWFFALHITSPTMDSVLQCELRAVAPAYVELDFG